jgi:hypothetical protein
MTDFDFQTDVNTVQENVPISPSSSSDNDDDEFVDAEDTVE